MHSSTRSQDMERRTKCGAIRFPARTRRKQAERQIKLVLQCQLQMLRLTQLWAAKKGGKYNNHSTFGGSEARTELKIGAGLLYGCLHLEKI